MRVACYRNLRRQEWSVAEIRGNGIGRVISHEQSVALVNVTFVVKENARQRVIRNHCREVHAWAVGELAQCVTPGRRTAITYNPYRAATFTTREDGIAVHAALCVEFTASEGALALLADGSQ